MAGEAVGCGIELAITILLKCLAVKLTSECSCLFTSTDLGCSQPWSENLFVGSGQQTMESTITG